MNVSTMQHAIRQRVQSAFEAISAAPVAPALGARDLTRAMRRDHNGDGRLGVDEFQPSQARKHSMLDLNQDGSVDLKELQEVARRRGVVGSRPTAAPHGPRFPAAGATRAPVAPAAPPPAPTAAPASPPAAPAPAPRAPGASTQTPLGEAPYINQYEPAGKEQGYTNGPSNCGPTSMAMIARAVGYGSELSDAALINHLGAIGGTNADGTMVHNLVPMAEAMGLSAEVKGPGADVGWIAEQLQAGKMVVANGTFNGHYVLVTGMTPEGNFRVQDPADAAVSTFSPAELERFIASNANGGYQIAVG